MAEKQDIDQKMQATDAVSYLGVYSVNKRQRQTWKRNDNVCPLKNSEHSSRGNKMNNILLTTMDGKDVSFTGELVNQTEESVEFSDDVKRGFTLKLYKIESGGFVPTIEYASESPLERTGCIAEIVDLIKDVENFFYVFVPKDLFSLSEDSAGVAREDIEVRRRLLNAMSRTYENLTFSFLDHLEQFVTNFNDNQAATKSAGK